LQPIFLLSFLIISLFVAGYAQEISAQESSAPKKTKRVYPPDHPINTRCMPESPCLSFPADLIQWDRNLQARTDASKRKDPSLINDLKWQTEGAGGISLMVLFFVLLLVLCCRMPKFNFLSSLKGVGILTLGMAFSDLFSNVLKLYFGRLKPHVDFYNPKVVPALSFPSSHAFNTSAFVILGFFLISSLQPRFSHSKSLFFIFCILFTLAICYSRVYLGQHYPLDVLAGILFGSLYGVGAGGLWHKAKKSKFWRHRLP